MIAAHTTKKLMEPQAMAWAGSGGTDPDYLSPEEVLSFAGLKAFARMRPVRAVSDWMDSTGRSTSTERAARSTGTVLRIEGGVAGGFLMSHGPFGPTGTGAVDWRMRASLEGPGTAIAEMMSCRTIDKEVVNKASFEHARATLASVFAEGVTFQSGAGVPDFAHWIAPMVNWKSSPFANDYLVAVPDEFRHGTQFVLPTGAGAATAAKLANQGAVAPSSNGSVAAVDLGYGTTDYTCHLLLHDNGTACWLELAMVDLSGAPELVRQRLFRNCVTVLNMVRALLNTEHPDTASAIDAALARLLAGVRDPNRVGALTAVWDKDRPSFEVSLGTEHPFPIGVVITSTQKYALDRLRESMGALLARQRTWSRGLRQKSLDKNRIATLRLPALLGDANGKSLPYIRYVHAATDAPEVRLRANPDTPWFWEVAFRSLPVAEGYHRSLVLLNGFSTSDHLLSYGPELFVLFQNWVHVMRSRDPHLLAETLYVNL